MSSIHSNRAFRDFSLFATTRRESSMRDLSSLAAVLNRIECPSARKTVIISKRERRQITDVETRRLMQLCEVEAA